MEFGPRALGNRSILGDPRIRDMQRIMNIRIKKRESFRPFAPAILDDYKKEYYNLDSDSPYMLITKKIVDKFLVSPNKLAVSHEVLDRVNQVRSLLPGITHIDNSSRVQTVEENRNKLFHQLLKSFHQLTGCPILINTSFNIRGEPIVCTPEDALRCFIFTELDILVLGNYIILKSELPNDIDNYFSRPLLIED